MAVASGESLRANLKQMTRQKLVESAQECFEEKGYVKTSAEDITSRIGASRATFYLHFSGGKPEVLAEIFTESHIGPLLELMDKLDSLEEPLETADLRSWLEEYRSTYARTRSITRAWFQGEAKEGPALQGTADTIRDRFLDIMSSKVTAIRRRNRRRGTEEDSRLRALLMFVELDRFLYYAYLRNLPLNVELGLDLIAQRWSTTLMGES
ncbi:TetR/AcrR family transcriptional regulator [Rhodococcus rhodochrous]|uniref:TetR/AcrR family transcriptional regulator n=1 Tax=Rhodococcus rhodochrous TaxID=1829 RepID=UPI00036CB32E|nr:TetR/AcrR family transcriptional regulator [Rhodococcus rhodochrous]